MGRPGTKMGSRVPEAVQMGRPGTKKGSRVPEAVQMGRPGTKMGSCVPGGRMDTKDMAETGKPPLTANAGVNCERRS